MTEALLSKMHEFLLFISESQKEHLATVLAKAHSLHSTVLFAPRYVYFILYNFSFKGFEGGLFMMVLMYSLLFYSYCTLTVLAADGRGAYPKGLTKMQPKVATAKSVEIPLL